MLAYDLKLTLVKVKVCNHLFDTCLFERFRYTANDKEGVYYF